MYWLEIILWEFWAWKSFYTHRSITNFWHRKSIKIWNYTSPDFDLQFRSINDLILILDAIYNFKKDRKNIKQRIEIIIDEAPIYFWNREFKNFPKKLLSFLVQLRKLNVSMKVIAQDLKMLDINFRRLCYNVKKYYKFLYFVRIHKNYELLSEDANINDPINTIMSKPYFHLWPSINVFLFWLKNKIFGSSLYDTNELIIPDYNILDLVKLNTLFPYTYKIETDDDYLRFLVKKLDNMVYFYTHKTEIKKQLKAQKKLDKKNKKDFLKKTKST